MVTGPHADAVPQPRDRLLDAADRLFYERGINATGVDAVIAMADVARMTLYKQFGGKAGLVTAYLEARDARWRADLERAVAAAGDDPIARVLAVFDALEQWMLDTQFRGCSFANAAAELADIDHPARAVISGHKQALRRRLAALVRDTGAADPEGIADELLVVFEGALATAALDSIDHPTATAKAIAHQLVTRAQR